MMKLYFSLFLLISFSSILATTNLSLNLELSKISNSDSNVILLLKNLDINLSNAISAYPGKLQVEQMKKAIDSSACLKMYSAELNKPIYKAALDTLESKFIQFDHLLKKYSEDKQYKDELVRYNKSVSLLPKDKVCRFIILK